MKKIGLITTNRVLAQSVLAALQQEQCAALELHLLLDTDQVAMDAAIQEIDVAVLDVTGGIYTDYDQLQACCVTLKDVVPGCRILLLVPQQDQISCDMAMRAIRQGMAEEFVFYDTSLRYFFAKLAAI